MRVIRAKASLWIGQSPDRSIVLDSGITGAIDRVRTEAHLGPTRQRNDGAHARRCPGIGCRRVVMAAARACCRTGSLENLWEIEPEPGRSMSPSSIPARAPLWWIGYIALGFDADRPPPHADRTGGLVNWMTAWRVELDPRDPRPLEIDLDPGLELSTCRAPRYGVIAATDRVRATAGRRLGSGTIDSTDLVLLAHARVPPEGESMIPGVRPTNGTWTGGHTRVP